MGLSFRKRSGKIANGSTLIVPGQAYNGQKVIPNTFSSKSSYNQPEGGPAPPNQNPQPVFPEVSPTPQPSSTPTPKPTPTPIPVDNIVDAIIVTENVYIKVSENEYLKYD